MSITKTTVEYEDWLRSQTTVVDDEIKVKHKKMASGEFAFPSRHVLPLGSFISETL